MRKNFQIYGVWKGTFFPIQLQRSSNYREFDLNFTNKVHILISHVPQVIQRTGKGLFYQSEEVVEAAHAKFDKFWQRYKVIDVESDKHGENLLECVIDFVTKNI